MATAAYTPTARVLKAIALADHLDGAGIRSRRVGMMSEHEWELLSTAAAVPIPGDETRVLVISLLRTREEIRKRLSRLRRRRTRPNKHVM